MVPGKDHPLGETSLPNISAEGKRTEFKKMTPCFRERGTRKKEIGWKRIKASNYFKSLEHVASVKSIMERPESQSFESVRVRKSCSITTTFCEVAEGAFEQRVRLVVKRSPGLDTILKVGSYVRINKDFKGIAINKIEIFKEIVTQLAGFSGGSLSLDMKFQVRVNNNSKVPRLESWRYDGRTKVIS